MSDFRIGDQKNPVTAKSGKIFRATTTKKSESNLVEKNNYYSDRVDFSYEARLRTAKTSPSKSAQNLGSSYFDSVKDLFSLLSNITGKSETEIANMVKERTTKVPGGGKDRGIEYTKVNYHLQKLAIAVLKPHAYRPGEDEIEYISGTPQDPKALYSAIKSIVKELNIKAKNKSEGEVITVLNNHLKKFYFDYIRGT